MSTAERRLARILLATLFVALTCCDDRPPPPAHLLIEELENRCGELPCEWAQITGEPGQARYVETFHPGDHGIRLDGSGVSVRGPGGEPDQVLVTFGTVQAQLTAVCDPGSDLTVRIGLTQAMDSGAATSRIDTLEGQVSPPPEWGGIVILSLTARGALADGGLSGTTLNGSFRVTGITVSKAGPGSCVVSRIVIDDQLPRPDPGC